MHRSRYYRCICVKSVAKLVEINGKADEDAGIEAGQLHHFNHTANEAMAGNQS